MVLFFAVFIGGVAVTFNIKVLGGKISYFQSVSILGYCIGPIFLALIVIQLLKFFQIKIKIIRLIAIVAAAFWSILGKFLI
jgi:phage shock protein PspC (stress-responsive transcriptional regulator)